MDITGGSRFRHTCKPRAASDVNVFFAIKVIIPEIIELIKEDIPEKGWYSVGTNFYPRSGNDSVR